MLLFDPGPMLNLPHITCTENDLDSTSIISASSSKIANKRQSLADNQNQNLLTLSSTSNAVRRHASLAVDNPSRQVRQNILKRGSVAMEQIKKIDLDQEYSVYKQLGNGHFGYIKLAEHKQYKKNIAIKIFPRPQIKQNDFVREYNYSYFLSPHPNIIDTYDGMYQTNDDSAFFFVQEFSPHGSLKDAVESSTGGIGEDPTKLVFSKILSAIEFMHDENLVHRNIKAENVLLFDKEYNKIKITDFGLTRKVGSTVKHNANITPYHPPELCETIQNEVVTLRCSIDIWSLGILLYYCLKGKFPWQKASILNKSYWEWEQYIKRKIPNLPKRWDPFSEKSLKIFKKSLNTKPKDRWSAKDMRKFVERGNFLKVAKQESEDKYVYYPEETIPTESKLEPKENKPKKKKSIIHQWINNTLTTMAEISEQVVSARND